MPRRSTAKSYVRRSPIKKSGGHAYWSGQIKIALIYMPVHLFNATRRSSTIDLDLLDRRTGERIHHANVLESGKHVNEADIVRGYRTDKGYVYLEKDELQDVKLPSSDVLELTEFVDANTIPIMCFEKPLYVLPDGKSGEEIYITLRDAMRASGKIGIGQLTVRGREELCALLPVKNGLVVELLRYSSELRAPDDFFADLPAAKAKAANVKMAGELIEQLTAPFDPDQYEDHYHEAMMELIYSKQARRQPHYVSAPDKPKNVINLMDALRKSLKKSAHKPPKKAS